MSSRLHAPIVALALITAFAANAADRLTVYTVNYPLAYFAERIGGEHVDVVFPVPPDVDPAFWQPDAGAIAGFQQADLILLNGAGYAKWLKRASLPRRRLVNTSAAFQHDTISVEQAVTHQHGPGGEHSHAGTAFTTWLDLSQAIAQARAVKLALQKEQPEQAEAFTRNFQSLEQELADLDKRLMAITSRQPGKAFMVSHPVYQYLARRYELAIKSVMWEPELIPAEGQWRSLQQQLDTHHAEWMIWEGKPEDQSVKRLQALGLGSLVFDPCANIPDDGDFISVMKSNMMNLEKAFHE